MIDAELRAEIRRLFYAEHWTVGTIAATLHVHRDTVGRAIGAARFVPSMPWAARRASFCTTTSRARSWSATPG